MPIDSSPCKYFLRGFGSVQDIKSFIHKPRKETNVLSAPEHHGEKVLHFRANFGGDTHCRPPFAVDAMFCHVSNCANLVLSEPLVSLLSSMVILACSAVGEIISLACLPME